MKILSPQTINWLLKMRLLNGTPDGSNPELWTNERGRTVLEQIRCDTGIFFDVSSDQLIYPELNDVDSGESQAIH
jgi:hypothetical protein